MDPSLGIRFEAVRATTISGGGAMATFGKRVQPKHRAEPGDRKQATTPAQQPGAHAAAAPPAPAAPAPFSPPPSATPAPAAPELETPAPTELPAAPVSVSEPEASPVDHGPLRVLVVDDNEDVRGLLRIAFARADIEVVGTAGDSREAIALAQHDRPAIILLDVNLPEVAGLDLLPRLRGQCPQAKVVMFSAQVSSQVTEQAMQRGAVGFVEKGVSMKNVVAHLYEVAHAPAGQVVEPFPLRVYP
jgi:CheY-like chemotaxis protein